MLGGKLIHCQNALEWYTFMLNRLSSLKAEKSRDTASHYPY